jgi:hypothetical protein
MSFEFGFLDMIPCIKSRIVCIGSHLALHGICDVHLWCGCWYNHGAFQGSGEGHVRGVGGKWNGNNGV